MRKGPTPDTAGRHLRRRARRRFAPRGTDRAGWPSGTAGSVDACCGGAQ
ncbi:hypothetical protein GZL_00363 [Streptomyces sp. 769]|nr:hypothetical protein GZL_00363 [Streptomyces sp. 769]